MNSVFLVGFALVAIAVAIPVEKEPTTIVRNNFEWNSAGGYDLDVETDDGSKRNEVGTIKEVLNEENQPQKAVVVRGSYSYIREDGETEVVNYYADETGFHTESPPIPKL